MISADAVRRRLFGDAIRQQDDPAVFAEVDELISARVAAGQPAVLDATNVTRAARDRARQHGGPASALRFPVGEQVLLARNKARPITVRPELLLDLAATFRESASLAQLTTEGFAVVADAPAPEAVHWILS